MFDKEFNNVVAANAKRHQATETRAQDSFYHLTSLEPQLREDEKYYYIDIKSPPHEKENYHLTAHDRKIKLSFNRRSQERFEEGEEVQTSNKSEAITREFKVAEIVNDKKLTESYKNGILSYRLPKA
jgi:HSP20 family molecular chaperone IbpA